MSLLTQLEPVLYCTVIVQPASSGSGFAKGQFRGVAGGDLSFALHCTGPRLPLESWITPVVTYTSYKDLGSRILCLSKLKYFCFITFSSFLKNDLYAVEDVTSYSLMAPENVRKVDIFEVKVRSHTATQNDACTCPFYIVTQRHVLNPTNSCPLHIQHIQVNLHKHWNWNIPIFVKYSLSLGSALAPLLRNNFW